MSSISDTNFEEIKLALEDYTGVALLGGDVEFLIKLVQFSLKEVEKKHTIRAGKTAQLYHFEED